MAKINLKPIDQLPFLKMMYGLADIPKSLYLLGDLPTHYRPTVAIVGTRKPTPYGREITYRLSYDLAKQGVVVVSGLALGIDSVAHQAALDAGGTTIAVMPCGLDIVYPRSHRALAERIVANGGALISEYDPGTTIYPVNFIARNRIVAGIASGVLVTEAAIKSGTLHTAGFALNYGRPVMAVPGEITNTMSSGTNNLIKTGACLVTSIADILHEMGVTAAPAQTRLPLGDTPAQTTLIKLLAEGVRDGDELFQQSGLVSAIFSQEMTMLEIAGTVRALGANQWALA